MLKILNKWIFSISFMIKQKKIIKRQWERVDFHGVCIPSCRCMHSFFVWNECYVNSGRVKNIGWSTDLLALKPLTHFSEIWRTSL